MLCLLFDQNKNLTQYIRVTYTRSQNRFRFPRYFAFDLLLCYNTTTLFFIKLVNRRTSLTNQLAEKVSAVLETNANPEKCTYCFDPFPIRRLAPLIITSNRSFEMFSWNYSWIFRESFNAADRKNVFAFAPIIYFTKLNPKLFQVSLLIIAIKKNESWNEEGKYLLRKHLFKEGKKKSCRLITPSHVSVNRNDNTTSREFKNYFAIPRKYL